jgi:hypothetical protein
MAELYKVEDVTERTHITRSGLIQKMYRVVATSKSGTIFTVEIPEPDFTEEKVDEILKQKAALVEKIKGM